MWLRKLPYILNFITFFFQHHLRARIKESPQVTRSVFLCCKARLMHIKFLNYQTFGGHIAVAEDQHKIQQLRIVATFLLITG